MENKFIRADDVAQELSVEQAKQSKQRDKRFRDNQNER